MKRFFHSFRLLGLLLLLSMTAVMPVSAASAKKLFTLEVQDGYQTQSVQVYEAANGSSLTMKAKTLKVNPAAKTMKLKVTDPTRYYTAGYTQYKVTAAKTLKAGKSRKVTIKATKADGTVLSGKLTVTRPSKPTISSSKLTDTSMTEGGTLSGTVKLKSQVAVSVKLQILNASGSTIYSEKLGDYTEKNPSLTWAWNGEKKNGGEAEAGSYKARIVLSYIYGKKTKTVKKNASFTITEEESKSSGTVAAFTKTWDWKVMVTGNDTVDYLAEYICQAVLKPGMSEVKRAKKLYRYCETHFTSNRIGGWKAASSLTSHIDITSTEAKAAIKNYSKQVDAMIASGTAVKKISGMVKFNANNTKTAMVKWSGDCLNMARMYQVLCRHAGLDADILHNSLKSSDPLKHYWNVVKIGDNWYECDPRMGFLRNEGYVHFLRGTKFMETLNEKAGNNADNVKQYSNIDSKYKKLYAKVSKTDCPGR